jgi:hypothetical protein
MTSYAPWLIPSQDHPGRTEAPIGRDVWMRSMSARFMNCSSASTRTVYEVLFPMSRAKSRNCQQLRAGEDICRADTYAQKTVEINAIRVEGAMKVIDRILDSVILRDEVHKSMGAYIRICI